MIVFARPEFFFLIWYLLFGGMSIITLFVFWRFNFLKKIPNFYRACTSSTVVFVKGSMLVCSTVLAFLVYLGPSMQRTELVSVRQGMEIASVIDCSRSMLAPIGAGDFITSRHKVVVDAVDQLLSALPDDSKGVACFSGELHLRSPLSTDYIRDVYSVLNKIRLPGFVERYGSGTNFSKAIQGCFALFQKDTQTKKVCIILSDGEQIGSAGALAREFREIEMSTKRERRSIDVDFYLVGVGDPTVPMLIPTRDKNGNHNGFLCCDEDGEMLETKPDLEYLKNIAAVFGGTYIHVWDGSDLLEELSDIIETERATIAEREEVVQHDISEWFFVPILFILFLWFLLPKRFSRPNSNGKKLKKSA